MALQIEGQGRWEGGGASDCSIGARGWGNTHAAHFKG
jgi:hypothetical protein